MSSSREVKLVGNTERLKGYIAMNVDDDVDDVVAVDDIAAEEDAC